MIGCERQDSPPPSRLSRTTSKTTPVCPTKASTRAYNGEEMKFSASEVRGRRDGALGRRRRAGRSVRSDRSAGSPRAFEVPRR